MISEIDIYRAGNLLIERHGVEAFIEAGRRIDLTLVECRDLDGRIVWIGIKRAIEALRPPPNGAPH